MAVQRINFIEKGAWTLTYRNMLIFVGLTCVICTLINVGLSLRSAYLKSYVGELKRQAQELMIQKDKALAAMQLLQNQTTSASVAPLAALFSKTAGWSNVLENLVKFKPKQLWLDNVRSIDVGERTDLKKLEIAGKSVSNAAIAQFVGQLDGSGKFKNTVLMNSQKDKNGYTFLVNTEIPFQEAEW